MSDDMLTFREALAKSVISDTLFVNIDCGAFAHYRFNPDNCRVEYWNHAQSNWEGSSSIAGEAKDWVITNRKRSDNERLVYEKETNAPSADEMLDFLSSNSLGLATQRIFIDGASKTVWIIVDHEISEGCNNEIARDSSARGAIWKAMNILKKMAKK